MKYDFRTHYPKIENKLFNEGAYRSASQAIDLCASIEDVLAELVQASYKNDLCPVYVDGEAKKEVMLAIRELNRICNSILSNDEAPISDYTQSSKAKLSSAYGYSATQNGETLYADSDVEFKRCNSEAPVREYTDTDLAFKSWLNQMYGRTAEITVIVQNDED